MYINQQALDIAGVTYQEYLNWCQLNNKAPYKKKTRKEFFKRITDERIIRDKHTGELVNKRPRNKVKENKEWDCKDSEKELSKK